MTEKLRNPSLKRRILALALTAITLTWLGAVVFTYLDARKELEEMLDAHLAQTASLLIAQARHELDEIETEHAPQLHKYSRRVAFQIWEGGRQLRMHSANAPDRPLAKTDTGFSNSTIQGRSWRVFSTWDDSGAYLIQVAERSDLREELARDIASHLLQPLLFALPLLALLLWFAVARGLHPLVSLTRAVEQRAPDNLAPLATTSAPREVMPLIERLNKLFVRISASLENERRFTADAAHELRTPVAAIKAQAQVARGATEAAERDHALAGAITGCDRATHLIEQLLTLSRLETAGTSALVPCPLHALATEVMAESAPAALSKQVQLELAEGEEITIPALPALLRIMLRNLIDNAVRHTPSGTLVRVAIETVDGRPCISIRDNGPGLPEEELARISQRFYRPLGTEASGSGLGLSIVRRIAEIHGAELNISPGQNGQGLCVTISFKLP